MEYHSHLHNGMVEEFYLSFKPYLLSIAYRMLGSLTDAEDIVQDTFLQLQRTDISYITNAKSYLSKMVTNRCINEMKSARKKREAYQGAWLPEPIIHGQILDPSEKVIQDDSLSYALLRLMEELSAMERAVYVLRTAHVVHVNNQKGILIVKDDKPIGVFSFVWHPSTHKIRQLFYVVNPDKLQKIDLSLLSAPLFTIN
ncbi:sigma factor [Brevibacillus halotolerans]|nr:sigma factor [Brevibacillus halotolerans]